jgi:hypothetical protein
MMLVNMARMPRRVPSWNVRMKAHTCTNGFYEAGCDNRNAFAQH